MLRTRFLSALLAAALAVAPLSAGPSLFKKKIDGARAGVLIETLKGDPDERKRKAAAEELGGADSRVNPEVATALVAALRKDASPSVRAAAASALGSLGQVVPVAGEALEAAASGDASLAVRLAAKRALWEYHLNGYRGTSKGGDGVAGQTVEPPIASPAGPRPAMAVIPAPPPPSPSTTRPTSLRPALPPASAPAASKTPPPPWLAGPRYFRMSSLADIFPGLRVANKPPANPTGPPPILNMTNEPPVAKRPPLALPPLPSVSPVLPPVSPVPPPTVTVAPPPLPVAPKPDYVPTLPFVKPDLPSVVLPPDAEAPPLAPPAPPPIPPTLPPIG